MSAGASTAAAEFHGIALPAGIEQRILYHSSFRAIITYAMTLADLDRELQHVLRARSTVVKDDARRNLCGKRAQLKSLPPSLAQFLSHANCLCMCACAAACS